MRSMRSCLPSKLDITRQKFWFGFMTIWLSLAKKEVLREIRWFELLTTAEKDFSIFHCLYCDYPKCSIISDFPAFIPNLARFLQTRNPIDPLQKTRLVTSRSHFVADIILIVILNQETRYPGISFSVVFAPLPVLYLVKRRSSFLFDRNFSRIFMS